MSTIAILGTGLMCKALGEAWSKAGHTIRVGTRRPDAVTAAELGFVPASVTDHGTAIGGSDAVVLAVPFRSVAPLVHEHRQALRQTVVIDISNPFDALPHNERAAAEINADALGTTNGIVAAFKDNFAATINEEPADAGPRQVKIAGDDPAAKRVVAQLAADIGHVAVDCGSLHDARLLDPQVTLMLLLDGSHAGGTMRTGWRFVGLPMS